jgi:hypothetical protein
LKDGAQSIRMTDDLVDFDSQLLFSEKQAVATSKNLIRNFLLNFSDQVSLVKCVVNVILWQRIPLISASQRIFSYGG